MPGIAEVLTRQLGPLPMWAWGGIGIGGGFLLYRSGLLKSLSGTSTPAATASSTSMPPAQTTSGENAGAALSQEVGLLQQLQAFQQQSYQNNLQQIQQTQQTQNALNPPPPAGPPTPVGSTVFPRDPTTGAIYDTSGGCKRHLNQQEWAGLTAAGAKSTDVAPQQLAAIPDCAAASVRSFPGPYPIPPAQPMGGASHSKRIPARFHAIAGGRPALGAAHGIWRGGHPMLGGPRAAAAGPADVTYPHYAMGGARNVHQVAAHMGVHPARVLAVNGHMRAGQARPGQIIRVV